MQVIAIAAAAGFLLSAPLRWLYRRLWVAGPRAMLIGSPLACWIVALAWRAIINTAYMRDREAGVGGGARAAAARDLRRHAVLDGAAPVLDRPLLRREVLRAPAARARGDAPAVRARPGGAAQDAALPAEPAFPVQHAERDLDARPRRPEPHGEPRGLAALGVPALHARPGPDEEGHAAPGARRAQPLPRHREAALRRPAAARVRRGRARRVRARARRCCCSRWSRTR